MRLLRTAVAMIAIGVLTIGVAAPANALPNITGGDDSLFTIQLVVPDPSNVLATCSISFTPTSTVTFLSTGLATGTANESGRVRIASSGCASVTWTSVAIVKDEGPGHPTRTVVGTGTTSAAAAQTVTYASGVREAGLVTITLLASSRLGDFCWEDIWQVSALGNPTPVKSSPC